MGRLPHNCGSTKKLSALGGLFASAASQTACRICGSTAAFQLAAHPCKLASSAMPAMPAQSLYTSGYTSKPTP